MCDARIVMWSLNAWGPVISYDVGHAKSYDVVGAVKSYCWVSVGPCDWCHVKSYGGGSEM